jgi:hypothetical protein
MKFFDEKPTQEAREEERRREGRGEEPRADKIGNYSSITGFATIRRDNFVNCSEDFQLDTILPRYKSCM